MAKNAMAGLLDAATRGARSTRRAPARPAGLAWTIRAAYDRRGLQVSAAWTHYSYARSGMRRGSLLANGRFAATRERDSLSLPHGYHDRGVVAGDLGCAAVDTGVTWRRHRPRTRAGTSSFGCGEPHEPGSTINM